MENELASGLCNSIPTTKPTLIWTVWTVGGKISRQLKSTAPARRPAGVALAASTRANKGQLPALGAGVAFITLHASDANLLGERRRGAAVANSVAVSMTIAVPVAVTSGGLKM